MLVESYGGHGIRVEKEEDIDAAFAEAKKYKDVPVIIEFMIATDEIDVYKRQPKSSGRKYPDRHAWRKAIQRTANPRASR